VAKVDKKIYFSGDSFTYGEGLELYTPTDKWRAELYKFNTWGELQLKIDSSADNYRKQNNFVGIFSQEFPNFKVYQNHENGGSLSHDLDKKFLSDIQTLGGVDYIIIQFTTFSRNCLHLNYTCECSFCKNSDYAAIDSIPNALHNIQNNNGISNQHEIALDEFCKLVNFYDINSPIILDKYDEFYNDTIKNQIEIFKNNYLNKFLEDGVRVFFIDSWDSITSNHLQNDKTISELTIPLISPDGNSYKKWNDFISKFYNPWIYQEYSITANHHPTPKVHQYIGESLIKFFKSDYI